MWALCDLATALLLQKTTNFDYKDNSSEIKLPSMYFKRNPDPSFVNATMYIPAEFQYTVSSSYALGRGVSLSSRLLILITFIFQGQPTGNKKPPALLNITSATRGRIKGE